MTMNKVIPLGFESIAQYLEGYNGKFPFMIKVRLDFLKKGKLSPAQWNAVAKCKNADEARARQQQQKVANVAMVPMVPSCNVNIVLSRFIANRVATENKLGFVPFTYTITSIKWETAKAFGVTMKPQYSNVSVCSCCGKDLTDWRSQATGMGAHCAKKLGIPYVKTHADVQPFKDMVMKKFQAVGELTVTLPKSQIKNGLADLGILCKQPTANTVAVPVKPAVTAVPQTVTASTKPAIQRLLLSMDQLTYNESTDCLSIELSDINDIITSRPDEIIVTNFETGNVVRFTFVSVDKDDEDIYGYRYTGTYIDTVIALILIND